MTGPPRLALKLLAAQACYNYSVLCAFVSFSNNCEENIICGGDFSCPLNPMLDKRGGVMVPRKMVIDNIECLKTELDLVDVWRIKNYSCKNYQRS